MIYVIVYTKLQRDMQNLKETGHAKNMVNLEKIIYCCKTYGTAYNPGKHSIGISQLESALTESYTIYNKMLVEKSNNRNLITQRMNEFASIRPLKANVINKGAHIPNGEKPSSQGLKVKLNRLEEINRMLRESDAQLTCLRTEFYKKIYLQLDSLTDLGTAVKIYIKSVFGAASPQFQQITNISFTKIRNN